MTSSSSDAGSTPQEPEATESPYAIGLAPDDDAAETGPQPLDTELEDQQVAEQD